MIIVKHVKYLITQEIIMTEIITPVGRMVQGDPFKVRTTNMDGKPLINTKGDPRVEYFFAIAIAKDNLEWPAMLKTIQQEAVVGFPNGQTQLPTFSWKIVDGDAATNKDKDGFPGHWVVRCSSGFQPKIYTKGITAQIVDPEQLKRGYYIRTYLSIRANGSLTKPGVYINPSMIEVIAYGEEIQSGPDAMQVFGTAPVGALPFGASEIPLAGSPITPPVATGSPLSPPVATGSLLSPPVATGSPVAPPVATGSPLSPPVAAGSPIAPPVAAGSPLSPPVATGSPLSPPVATGSPLSPPVKTMTSKAKGVTYDQMVTAGWTDDQMITEGYLINTTPGVAPNPAILDVPQ